MFYSKTRNYLNTPITQTFSLCRETSTVGAISNRAESHPRILTTKMGN